MQGGLEHVCFPTHWVCGSTVIDLKITQITRTGAGAAPCLIA